MALVTLTSDFGTADGYAGAMKGVLAALAPAATIVDLTHDVPRHDVAAAAHALATAAPHFPPGTIHVAVVDPGVGGARGEVVVVSGGQLFVGPDNGVFARVAPRPEAAYAITAATFRRADASPTFHGRDVFAVAAAALARGEPPSAAGPACELAGAWQPPAPTVAPGRIVGTIVHVDRWGNVVTDIGAAELAVALPAATAIAVRVGGRAAVTARLGRTFEDVPRLALVAYLGSGATVEIAVREGDAAAQLGGAAGEIIQLQDPA